MWGFSPFSCLRNPVDMILEKCPSCLTQLACLFVTESCFAQCLKSSAVIRTADDTEHQVKWLSVVINQASSSKKKKKQM